MGVQWQLEESEWSGIMNGCALAAGGGRVNGGVVNGCALARISPSLLFIFFQDSN